MGSVSRGNESPGERPNTLRMRHLVALFFCLLCTVASAQPQTYDITSFSAPSGWTMEEKATLRAFSRVDGADWAQIGVYRHAPSKGSPQADFASEWQALVAGPHKVTQAPDQSDILDSGGWKVITGSGLWNSNGKSVAAVLTTFTGHGVCVSILANVTNQSYAKDYQALLESVNLDPAKASVTKSQPPSTPVKPSPAVSSAFKFTTSNFDDGWTAVEQADWVEVSKGPITVLLHYPREGTIIPADPEPHTNNAWDKLVAPRYKNLRNYKVVSPNGHYRRGYLAAGYVTESASGREVYVALFKHAEPQWVEVIAPSKEAFVAQFGADVDTMRWDTDYAVFNALNTMTSYNKFAVAASDFRGSWTSRFTGMQQLYNVFTGLNAGMYTNQSNEDFVFAGDGTYSWKLLVVNTAGGVGNASQVASRGSLKVLNNWQVAFSDIEGKPRQYNAHWSCVKGGRLLHLLDSKNPGSGIPTIYGKKP